MPILNICYFALLREKAGVDQESYSTDAETYGELFEELSTKYSFDLPPSMIQVAVNDEFCSMKQKVIPDSKVVFIPPVAGG